MINPQMRDYNYYTYGEQDAYGQPALSDKKGTVKMAINVLSKRIEDNVLYAQAEYIGLTSDAKINDKYVIAYGSDRLKVLYVYPYGRLKQVFMARCE